MQREVARRSGLTSATVSVIMGGRHGDVTDRTLEAFASVLPVSVDEARAALGKTPDPGEPWTPPEQAKHLTREQRVVLDRLIKVMVPAEAVRIGVDDGDGVPITVDDEANARVSGRGVAR